MAHYLRKLREYVIHRGQRCLSQSGGGEAGRVALTVAVRLSRIPRCVQLQPYALVAC